MKPWISGMVFSSLVFFLNGALWADPNDPVLPGPKLREPMEGMAVGSLISTAIMVTPKKSDGSGGDVVVWGYRKNGHSGNYNHNGNNVGFEHNLTTERESHPRFETIKDFKNPSHPLYGQKLVRLFTTAHTLYALTEEGELWAWGDSVFGTAGCVDTGYETTWFADYGNVYLSYEGKKAPHYQARPCPVFGTRTPKAQVKKKIAYVDGGEYNVIAMTDDGEVYTWGSGTFYQTTDSTTHKRVPHNITHYFVDANGEKEQVILVGGAYEGQYAVSVDKRGKYTLWGWGRSFYHSLVNSANDVYLQAPTRLTQYDQIAKEIIYVNGGYGWTAVLLADGRIYGSGRKRLLGLGDGGAGGNVAVFTPQLIMGGNSGYPRATKLIVRYIGGVAVPENDDKALYTWGWTEGSAYMQIYGDRPTRRPLAGKLKSVGTTKEAIFYLTDDNKLYGVGYGDQRVINVCDNDTISWDRERALNVKKNSMNWYRKKADGTLLAGGYRIPYEGWTDVTGRPYCDGDSTGYYSGTPRQDVRKWTAYDDGRDGPIPSPTNVLTCQDSEKC